MGGGMKNVVYTSERVDVVHDAVLSMVRGEDGRGMEG